MAWMMRLWNRLGKVSMDGIDIFDYGAFLSLNTGNNHFLMLGDDVGDGLLLLE